MFEEDRIRTSAGAPDPIGMPFASHPRASPNMAARALPRGMEKKEITYQWVVDKSNPAPYFCAAPVIAEATEGGASTPSPGLTQGVELTCPRLFLPIPEKCQLLP